jgi:hypothetical protein
MPKSKQSKNVVTSGWPNRHLTGCAAEKLSCRQAVK